MGYDGELTQMTFRHVIGNDCFNDDRQRMTRDNAALLAKIDGEDQLLKFQMLKQGSDQEN